MKNNITLEFRRNYIQEKKLEALREYHEAVGELKAKSFEFFEEKDYEKKEIIFKRIELIKKLLAKKLAQVDKYNEFLEKGHITPEDTKGLHVDVKI